MGDAKDWSSSSNSLDDNAIAPITEDDLKGKSLDQIMELAMRNAEAKILQEEAYELAMSNISEEEITRHRVRLERERQKQEAMTKESYLRQAAWAASVVAALLLGFGIGR